MPKSRYVLFPIIVAATVLFQLAVPVVARADDGVPPPDQPAAEVTPDPGEEATSTDATSLTEAATESPSEETPTEVISAPTDVATETLADVAPEEAPLMAQVPEGTEVVVLNADGTVEPLATQAAADAIATGDPVWCPAGQHPGDGGCLDNGGSGYASLTALLTAMAGSSAADGTIWIEDSYSSSTDDSGVSGFYLGNFSGGYLTTWTNNALTIQGGWDGNFDSSGTTTGTSSVFTVPISIDWNASLTISDIASTGSAGYGLDILTTGDISVSNVDVIGAGYSGAFLANDIGSGTVSVANSDFSGNNGTGLEVYTTGTITVDGVTASGNTNGDGADLNADSQIDVSNSTFSDNGYTGLSAGTSSGDVNLTDVTASGNQYGAIVGTDSGNVTVTSSTFDSNTTGDPEYPGIGLQAGTGLGNITLTDVTASGNDIGAMAGSDQGDVTITNGNYSDNTDIGLAAGTMQGTITLTDVVANNTTAGQDYGVVLGNMNGSIEIYGGQFNGNTSMGVYIQSTGLAASDPDVTLSDLEASGNGLKGVYVGYYAPCGRTTGGVDVELDSGDFENNGAFGVYAAVGPDGSLTIVTPPVVGNNGGATGPSLYDIVVNNRVQTCPPAEEPKPKSKPYNIVEVPETGGVPVEQNCTDYSGTVLILPDDDKIVLTCPSSGDLTLSSLPQSGLPGSLPQGPEFVSAMQIGLADGGQPVTVLTGGGVLKLAFKLPEDAKPTDHFAILYWDPTAGNGAGGWVELPEFRAFLDGSPLAFALHPNLSPDDGMRIFSGTRLLGDYVKATVNFTGVFVLVKK